MRRALVCVAVALLSMGIIACGGDDDEGEGGGSVGTSDSGGAEGKEVTFVTALIQDQNWARLNGCFEDAAEEAGIDATVVGPPAGVDIPRMVSQIEQAIAQRPDAIVTSALDPPAFQAVLDEAKGADIPVLTVVVGGANDEWAFLGVDFEEYGRQAAELLAEETGGEATIGILSRGPDVTNQLQANEAFKEALEQYPDMKVVEEQYMGGELNKATEVARAMLVAHDDLTAIYGPDGFSAIAAGEAAKQVGRAGEITIIGSDLLPQQARLIEDGTVFASLAFVSCKIGEDAVQILVDHFNGTDPESPIVIVPAEVYTKDTLPPGSTEG